MVAAAAVRLICSSPTALYHPTVSVCSAYTPSSVLCLNSLARAEAAGGEYLHKYWTKTGRNSRTATGLILDKYFTRPTNTAGGGGRGVRGVENEQHLGKHTQVRGGGLSDSCFLYIFMCTSSVLGQISPNMKC